MKRAGYDPTEGDAVLGGMKAYQLFIPALYREHGTLVGQCRAKSKSQILHLLGIRDPPLMGKSQWPRGQRPIYSRRV